MENKTQNTSTQLSENLYIKGIKKEDKTYYILRYYYNFEEDGRKIEAKKDIFINEGIANELFSLLLK